jgi:hypothetical protein
MSSPLSVYVDGFNLYHAIDEFGVNKYKWINLWLLADSFRKPSEHLVSVVFFTAILNWNQQKQARHKTYITAQRVFNVEVFESNFKRVTRRCAKMGFLCPRHEEKQTDVAIAVRVPRDAKELRASFPTKRVTLAAPPGRAEYAKELGQFAHERKPISAGRLGRCIMERDIFNAKGKKVATMPASYG